MVTCGSAFPAEGGLEPWCTSGLLSRSSSFRLLQGTFLEVSLELTTGLETPHTKSSPSRDVPLQKAVILEGDYSSLVLRDQLLGCFCQYCMRGTSSAAHGDLQFVVICSLSQLG